MADKRRFDLKNNDQIKGIKDDTFMFIDDEYEQIRQARGMYIAKGGTAGALHLLKEIFNNALDECNNENSIGKGNIYVTFDEESRMISVRDESRGIPLDRIMDVVTKKHTSTKFIGMAENRQKKSTGLNGVGLKVTFALTDYTSVTTLRKDKMKTVEIVNDKVIEHKEEKMKKPMTGLLVKFIPSEKYLGTIHLTCDMIEEYFRNISYLISPKILIHVTTTNLEGHKNTIICKSLGLAESVRYQTSSPEVPVVESKIETDEFDLSVAFTYDKTFDDINMKSFANFVITTEGGTHETVSQRAICEYFVKEARRQDPNSKYEVTTEDCKKGLIVSVNLEHKSPDFEGQHKSRVANEDVLDAKKVLVEALYNTLNANQNTLKKLITYLRTIVRVRMESNKIKGVSVKKQTTFLDDAEISKFYSVTDRNSTGYKELYIAEGDSAGGALHNCRNPHFQAIYTVRGVTDNVYGISLSELAKKEIFMDLIKIMGCGVGSDFDINKLKYQKIIIAADSDADGKNIRSLLFAFFLTFLPEIITSGRLYIGMPPLYLMDEKSLRRFYNGERWLYDKGSYYHMINSIICENIEVALVGKGDKRTVGTPLSKKDLMRWLTINAEYQIELDNFGKRTACSNTALLENICYFLKECDHSHMKFKKMIEKEYKEMVYDVNLHTLEGSLDKRPYTVICDSVFVKSAMRYLRELSKNETPYILYRNKKNKNDVFTTSTIGEFFDEMSKLFALKIEQRFKGWTNALVKPRRNAGTNLLSLNY